MNLCGSDGTTPAKFKLIHVSPRPQTVCRFPLPDHVHTVWTGASSCGQFSRVPRNKVRVLGQPLLVHHCCRLISTHRLGTRLPDKTATSIVTCLKSVFARHGIPQELRRFAADWGFQTTTSSPKYPPSNGLAERHVQTIKHMLKKADAEGKDPYLALLNFRSSHNYHRIEIFTS